MPLSPSPPMFVRRGVKSVNALLHASAGTFEEGDHTNSHSRMITRGIPKHDDNLRSKRHPPNIHTLNLKPLPLDQAAR